MASVGTFDTGPEKAVRSMVHKAGFRYSLRRNELPGRPDLTFVSRRKVIFVHGCFWHGHSCKYGRLPKSRLPYWKAKIEANRARDERQLRQLRQEGWSALVVWQCQLRTDATLQACIKEFLNG
jgi:DNA mismatch endonuclease (patch repair protein)